MQAILSKFTSLLLIFLIQNEPSMIIELKSSSTTAKILTDIGGRLVFFSNNDENILKSDEALWDSNDKPAVDAFSDFIAYNGAIVWVGPQSEWWTQQDINTERKDERAVWPPDPFLIYGDFEITEKTESSVTLKSPESPVSGIVLTKKYEIHTDGSLTCDVTLKNVTEKTVKWDVWFNTRMSGYCKSYTFCTEKDNSKTETMPWDGAQEMPNENKDGYFCYLPEEPEKDFNSRSSKSFIHPEKTFMAGFTEDRLLLIEFEGCEKEKIHSEQAQVEIFCHTEHDTNNSLLELEYHSAYKSIAPNETLSASQRWSVHNYTGGTNTENQIKTLNKLGY